MSLLGSFVLGSPLRILRSGEALEWLERSGKSLVRWGDGETLALSGRDLYFQRASPELARTLARVVAQDRSDIIVGLPAGPLLSPLTWHIRRRNWLRTRLLWARHGRADRVYVDAFLFRDEPHSSMRRLKVIAQRHAFVIGVSSNAQDPHLFADLGHPVEWIEIPSENCFATYDTILAKIRAATTKLIHKTGREDGLALISAGPAAKALVLDLSPGLKAYDVGHLFYFQRHEAKRNVWAR
jgi:hypothetical protein